MAFSCFVSDILVQLILPAVFSNFSIFHLQQILTPSKCGVSANHFFTVKCIQYLLTVLLCCEQKEFKYIYSKNQHIYQVYSCCLSKKCFSRFLVIRLLFILYIPFNVFEVGTLNNSFKSGQHLLQQIVINHLLLYLIIGSKGSWGL